MSDPLTDATSSNATTAYLLDGELPRLGGSAPAPTAAPEPAPKPTPFDAPVTAPTVAATPPAPPTRPTGPSPMLSAPGSAPVLDSAELPTLPSLPTVAAPAPQPAQHTASAPQPVAPQPAQPADTPSVPQPVAASPELPTLPSVTAPAQPVAASPEDDSETGETTSAPTPGEHPMAHLMPQKSAPNEASKRAAEIRAAKKAKARKIKVGVAIGALVFAAIVGPPLGKWFVNALNESGSTSTEIEE